MKKIIVLMFLVLLLASCQNNKTINRTTTMNNPSTTNISTESTTQLTQSSTTFDDASLLNDAAQKEVTQNNFVFSTEFSVKRGQTTFKSADRYSFMMNNQNDGLVEYQKIPDGPVINGTTDYEYYRIYSDKVITFSHETSDYSSTGFFSQSQSTNSDFMQANNSVTAILNGTYFNLLNHIDSYKQVTDNSHGYYMNVYQITNSNYDFYSTPECNYIKNIFSSYKNLINKNYFNHLQYTIYFDQITHLILFIDIDMTDVVKSIVADLSPQGFSLSDSYIIEYSFDNYNQVNIQIPSQYNFYDIASDETKANFNALYNEAMNQLDTVSGYSMDEDFEVDQTSSGGNGTSSHHLIKMDVLNNPKVVKTMLSPSSAFYTVQNNDEIDNYYFDGQNYVKTKAAGTELNGYLVPLDISHIRYDGGKPFNGQYDDTYSYQMSYADFIKEGASYLTYFASFLNKTDINYDNINFTIAFYFNQTDHTIDQISLDMSSYLQAISTPSNYYTHISGTLHLVFSDYGNVTFDTSFINNATTDDALNYVSPEDTELNLGTTYSGNIDYPNDIDVYSFTLTQAGNYDVNLICDDLLTTVITDSNGHIISTSENNFNEFQGAPGTYYLIISGAQKDAIQMKISPAS